MLLGERELCISATGVRWNIIKKWTAETFFPGSLRAASKALCARSRCLLIDDILLPLSKSYYIPPPSQRYNFGP